MRNHRKLYVIDGAIGYAGSQNIVARDFRPGVVNRELIVRVTGPVERGNDGQHQAHPPTTRRRKVRDRSWASSTTRTSSSPSAVAA